MKPTIKYLLNGEYHYATVKDIGDIEKLTTAVKTDLVSAINSIVGGAGSIPPDLLQKVEDLESQLEELANGGFNDIQLAKMQAIMDANIQAMDADLQLRLDTLKQTYDAKFEQVTSDYDQKVLEIQGNVTGLKNDLDATEQSLKETGEKLSGIELNYTTVTETVDLINGQLSTKVESSDFELLESTVNAHETEIAQTKESISLMADKESLDLATGQITDMSAKLEVQAGQIASTVKKEELKQELEGLEIYAPNILEGTTDWNGWTAINPSNAYVLSDTYQHTQIQEQLGFGAYEERNLTGLIVGKTYIASVWGKSTNIKAQPVFKINGVNNIMLNVNKDNFMGAEWQRFSVKFVASATSLRVSFTTISTVSGDKSHFAGGKVEIGTVNTGWRPNESDSHNRVVSAESSIKQQADQIVSVVTKQEKIGEDVTKHTTSINQLSESIELQATGLSEIEGKVSANEASIKLNDNSIKLKVEQNDIDKSVEGIKLDIRNGVLNSDFQRDFSDWTSVNTAFKIVEISGKKYAKITRSGLSANTIAAITTNKIPAAKGDRLMIGFDMIVDDLSKYDVKTPAMLELFDISDVRVDFRELTMADLKGSLVNGKPGRLSTNYTISRDDVAKVSLRLNLYRNGSVAYTNASLQKGDIGSTEWIPAPEDSQMIQASMKTEIEQNANDITLKASSDAVNKLSGDLESNTASLKVANDAISAQTETLKQVGEKVTSHTAELKQTSEMLSSKVTATEVDELLDGKGYATQSELKQTADGFDLIVGGINEDIEGNRVAAELGIKGATDSIQTLKNTTIPSLSDGLLNKAEKESIKQSLNIVESEKKGLDSQYNSIYANTSLTGTPKTNLLNAKTAYNTAQNELKAAISAVLAVADGVRISSTLITKVETEFSEYGTILATLNQRLQEALDAISGKKSADAESNAIAHTTAQLVIRDDMISSRVEKTDYTGAKVASLINQSADTVKIAAKNIDINGAVTFNSFDSATRTEINDKATKNEVANAKAAADAAAIEAQAAKTSANTAQSTANTAVSNAATANSLLSDFSSDTKITPLEKKSVKKEWDIIRSEKGRIEGEATRFNIGVEKTNYVNQYNTLSTYVTPIVANWSTTINIVGDTFRANFKNYYDARQDLLNAITTKAKTLADTAQGVADVAQTAAETAQSTANTANTNANSAQSTANTAKTNAATAQAAATSAQTAANTAQSTANTAKTNADTANGLLTDLASDSKLTASEKKNIKKEWDIIVSEKVKIDSEATEYSIGTEKTNFATQYNTLNTYVTPLLSNLNVSSDIVGTTFRTNFKNYYDARQDVLNAITTKSKSLADTAQSTANTAKTNAATAQTAADAAKSAAATAQSAANSAQSTANSATTSANTANTLLSDLSSDSILSPSEKKAIKKEWDIIVGEKPKIEAEGNEYGIATEKETYNTHFASLNTYITPLLSNLNVNSNIVGVNFRGYFKNYYDARQDLLNAITSKAKAIADSKTNQVEAMSGGGKIFKNPLSTSSSVPAITGCLVIRTPITSAYMTKISVSGYNYNSTTSNIDLDISFYAYTASQFANYSYTNKGSYPIDSVRLGRDSAGCAVIIIGTGNSTWSYPKVQVTEAIIGHSNPPDSYQNGWSVEYLGSLTAFTAVTDVSGADYKIDIGAAQSAADNAKASIADMSSDSKITPVEKVQLKKEWAAINAERASIDGLAATYGITTERTNMTNSYNTLNTVLNGSGGILSNMTTTTTVVGATFRGQFDDYYDKKAILQRKASETARGLANGAQGTADTVKGVVSNFDSAIINANPIFFDWPSTVPVGYASVSGATMAKVVSGNGMGNAVRFTVATAGTNVYLNPNQVTTAPFYEYVAIETTFKLDSGTIDGAGVLFRYNGTGITDHLLNLKSIIPSPTLNKWYTVTKVIRQATQPAGFTGYSVFPMGGWSSFGTPSVKVIQFDSLKTRQATEQEINAYESNIMISDMSMDSKITPVEKVQLKKEWATIVSERASLDAMAATYGVTTERTNMTNAYNTLNTVLNGTGGILLTMTATSTVVGSTFRAQFDDYYEKKAILQRKVNETAKTLANGAQSTANTANTAAGAAQSAANTANSGVSSINGKINNAVTTIDATGITVKDGSFYLQDDSSDTKYSVVSKSNLLRDHSFELIPYDATAFDSVGFNTVKTNPDPIWLWQNVGLPKVYSAKSSNVGDSGLFGLVSAAVSSTNYLRQCVPAMLKREFTASAFFTKSAQGTGGTPYLSMELVAADTTTSKYSVAKTFPVTVLGKVSRYSLSMTIPTTVTVLDSDYIRVTVKSGNTNWVLVDGVQLVEGLSPVLYEPETLLFDLMNGVKGSSADKLTASTVNVTDRIYAQNVIANEYVSELIGVNGNLNNYTRPGFYYCNTTAAATTISNTPTNLAFSLFVERHAGTKQIFTEYKDNSPRMFMRNYYNGVWGSWDLIAYDSGWINAPLLNGFLGSIQVRQIVNTVYFKGTFRGKALEGTNLPIFSVPSSIGKPMANIDFEASTALGGSKGWNVDSAGCYMRASDGEVMLGRSISSNTSYYLSTISYPVS